jgi:hypothetical protein
MIECLIGEVRAADSLTQHASEFVESVKGEEDRSRDVQDRDKSSEARKDRAGEVLFKRLREKCFTISRKNLAISTVIGVALLLLLAVIFIVRERKGNSLDLRGITPVDAEAIPSKSIALSATGLVKIVVRDKGTLEKIYAGNLPAGTAKTISYHRPVQVFYDRGEYLLIQQDNGEKVYPQPGRGGVEIK